MQGELEPRGINRRVALGGIAGMIATLALAEQIIGLASNAFAAPTGAQLPFPDIAIYRHWGPRSLAEDPWHKGCDWSSGRAGVAGTAVVSAASGVVADRGYDKSRQHWLEINHGNDASGVRWWTRYHMLQDQDRPAIGASVAQGQIIGRIAPKGGVSTAIHHHFEVHTSDSRLWNGGGRYTNPYNDFKSSVDPVAFIDRVPTNGNLGGTMSWAEQLQHRDPNNPNTVTGAVSAGTMLGYTEANSSYIRNWASTFNNQFFHQTRLPLVRDANAQPTVAEYLRYIEHGNYQNEQKLTALTQAVQALTADVQAIRSHFGA